MEASTVGIDVGGTKMLGVVLDGAGNVAVEDKVPTPRRLGEDGSEQLAGPDQVLAAIENFARRLIDAAGAAGQAVRSLGVGVPGLVDDEGVLRFAPNLLHGQGMALTAGLAGSLGLRVVADNDATCAAVGEWEFGSAVGLSDVVVVTLGTGIGGGVISGGRVQRGANGFAGEMGHMVVDPAGPRCPCGMRGCWERYVSGDGLVRLAREAASAGRLDRVLASAGGDPESVRGEHVTAAAAAGDEEARDVLAEMGWWLALGLANLANLLDPELLVVGGGLVVAGELLLAPARAALSGMLEGADERPPVTVRAASLGERAGAVGAAVVARHEGRDQSGTRL